MPRLPLTQGLSGPPAGGGSLQGTGAASGPLPHWSRSPEGFASVNVLLADRPETCPIAVRVKLELSESSGSTYQLVRMFPSVRPSRSAALPSVTVHGPCPFPVLGVPSLCST